MDIAAAFLSAILNAFEANKRLADRAIEQVPTPSSTPPWMRTRTPLPS
jgi:hypothetical protein